MAEEGLRAGAGVGYLDESYVVGPDGVYVLAALIADPADEVVRDRLRGLRAAGQLRPHFSKESTARRVALAAGVGGLTLPSVVTVRRSGDAAERARGLCLVAMAWALAGRVDRLVIDARQTRLNRHDATVLAGLAPSGLRLPVTFVSGAGEPLLWAADVTAGAVFQDLARGEPAYRAALGSVTQVDA